MNLCLLLPDRPLRAQKRICALCVQHHLLREPTLSAYSGDSMDGMPCSAPVLLPAVLLIWDMNVAGVLESVDGNTVIANTEDGQETVYQTNHIGSYFTYAFGPSDGLIPGQTYTVCT